MPKWDAQVADRVAGDFEKWIREGIEDGTLDKGTVYAIAGKWAHIYMTSGHKRLGRVLVKLAKEAGA